MSYQSLRTATAALALTLALAACGGSDKAETDTAGNTSTTTETASTATQPVTPPAPAPEPGMAFDGSSFAGTPLDESYESFAVVTRLRAAGPTADPAEFTETTPPMPFVVGGVWSSQLGDRVSINSQIVPNVTSDFREITVINMAGEGLKVYADGELVGEGDAVDAATSVRLGIGYKERYWTGRVDGFKVLDLRDATVFPEITNLTQYPVVFELKEGGIRSK